MWDTGKIPQTLADIAREDAIAKVV